MNNSFLFAWLSDHSVWSIYFLGTIHKMNIHCYVFSIYVIFAFTFNVVVMM